VKHPAADGRSASFAVEAPHHIPYHTRHSNSQSGTSSRVTERTTNANHLSVRILTAPKVSTSYFNLLKFPQATRPCTVLKSTRTSDQAGKSQVKRQRLETPPLLSTQNLDYEIAVSLLLPTNLFGSAFVKHDISIKPGKARARARDDA